MTSERARLADRHNLVRRDLDELAAQVEEGEIDAATADRLRVAYQGELESLEAALEDLPEDAPAPEPEPEPAESRPATARSPRRMVVGSVLLVAALSAVIAFAARDAEPEANQASSSSPGELSVDPATVNNEQLEEVVAANPNINGMRIALADRYFMAEDYASALGHYLYIADNNPTPAEETKVLARIGWMAYVTGLAQEAVDYVRASLDIDPRNAEATIFLGFITMYGLEDPEAAIPQLEAALELPDLSASVVSQIEGALAEARGGGTP